MRSDLYGEGSIYTTSASYPYDIGYITNAPPPPSWMTIRQTVNATDAEITQRFLNTAFCYVLHATVSERAQPQVEGFVLDPSEALAIPTPAQVQSRWPGMPDEDVEGILRDYEWESTRLRDYALGDVVERVKELAEGEWA